MASFSIQELLGLGKVNSSNSSEDDLPAAKNSKPRAAGHGTAASEPEAADIDKDIDVETLEEEDNAAEPVIVEVHSRIVSPALSVTRGAGASRKRKRSKQAEDSPAKSDGKPPKFSSGETITVVNSWLQPQNRISSIERGFNAWQCIIAL